MTHTLIRTITLNILLTTLTLSCTHQTLQQKFEAPLQAQNCDEALQNVPESTTQMRLIENSKSFAKNTLAFTYIAANYTTEVLWDASAGIILFAGVCAPFAVLHATYAPKDNPSFICMGATDTLHKYVRSPPLGRKSQQATQKFRCPNLTPLSNSILKVVSCYEQKGDKENLEKALTSLNNLEESSQFYSCLESEQQSLIRDKQITLKNALLSL